MLSIIIDQREPDFIKSLKFNNAQTVVSLLDAGDLMIATEDNQILLIERKTPEDLLGSIKDGRIFEQCHKMKQQTQWAYLVVTGQFTIGQNGKVFTGQRETGWNYDAVEGALLSIQELGVFVVHCKNDLDFGPTVERLAKRSRETLNIGAARSSSILSAGEQMLTTLPGLGYEKVKKLLAEYKNNPAEALCWLTWLGFEVTGLGIGDGIKSNVRKALGLQPNQTLYIHYDGEEIPF